MSSFYLWQNSYVHAVESKPVSTSKLLPLLLVVRSFVHYTKHPNTTLKIRFCYTQVLLKLSTFEHAVLPSKLMNRGWKYPLKNLRRGEGAPLKRENWEPCTVTVPANSCTNHFIWIPPLQVLPRKIHPHLLPNSKCCGPANNQNICLTDYRHFAWEKQLSIFQMEILSWNTAIEEKRKENHYNTLQFVLKKKISESIIMKTESTYFRRKEKIGSPAQ